MEKKEKQDQNNIKKMMEMEILPRDHVAYPCHRHQRLLLDHGFLYVPNMPWIAASSLEIPSICVRK